MKYLFLVLGAVLLTATSGCGDLTKTLNPAKQATVRVEAPDGKCWSGAIGDSTKDGCGTREFTIDGISGIFAANAQKQDDGPWSLKITLLVKGKAVDSAETSAAYGMAQVAGR